MKRKINWDAFGVATSVVCAVHCAILPVVLTSLPLFGINIIRNEAFEIFMIALALCAGIFALQHGRKHHGQLLPALIFSAGIFFLFAKEIWSEKEIFFLIPAVTLILTAHFINHYLCRKAAAAKNSSVNE
jgi:hypothetical protein